jgi:hypothetical protein
MNNLLSGGSFMVDSEALLLQIQLPLGHPPFFATSGGNL